MLNFRPARDALNWMAQSDYSIALKNLVVDLDMPGARLARKTDKKNADTKCRRNYWRSLILARYLLA